MYSPVLLFAGIALFAAQAEAASTLRKRTIALSNAKQKESRIIYFQHIHKSGGSTMCRIAAANKMKTPHQENCNVSSDQRCCGETIEALQEFAETTPYNFVANEGDMYEVMDPTRFRYVLLLRDSQARYLSHFRHVFRAHDGSLRINFSQWWHKQPDNFTFRKICGTRCQNVPKFHITQELFDYTLEKMGQFEDFLFLEDFSSSLSKFSRKVGWTKHPKLVANKDDLSSDDTISTWYYPSLETDDWDENMSALDDALYAYARQKYEGVEKPTLSEVERQGVVRYMEQTSDCSNECCAAVCSVY